MTRLLLLAIAACATHVEEEPHTAPELGRMSFVSIPTWLHGCPRGLELTLRCDDRTYAANDEWRCVGWAQYKASCSHPVQWRVNALDDGRIDRVCVRGSADTIDRNIAPILDSFGLEQHVAERMIEIAPTHLEPRATRGKLNATRYEWGADDIEICWFQWFGLTD